MMFERLKSRFFCTTLALATSVFRSSEAIVRGVAHEDQAKYAGATFRCFDGSVVELSAADVNDDSCDCDDGSDEPGTGACAGKTSVLFYCANKGSIARKLFVSRVGDGICDCCDGSDEAALAERWPAAQCPNVCDELGRKQREEATIRSVWLKEALATKAAIVEHAMQKRTENTAELAKLQAEIPALEKAVDEATKAVAAEREAEDATRKAEEVAENAAKEASEKAAAEKADQQKAEEGTVVEAAAPATDTEVAAVEAAPTTVEAEAAAVEAEAPAVDAEAAALAAGGEKPQLSEYTKWMDGAEETISEKVQAEETEEEEDATERDDEVEEDYPGDEDDADEMDTRVQTAAPASLAQREEKSAKESLKEAKSKQKNLEKEIALFEGGEHAGFASLGGKLLQKQVGDFNYKINFFDNAKQDHTSLGKWEGWTSRNSATFSNGANCWQGPARSLIINFQCGLNEDILDVIEPSRCVYQATIVHPGACDDADLQEALDNTAKVIGPRDEL